MKQNRFRKREKLDITLAQKLDRKDQQARMIFLGIVKAPVSSVFGQVRVDKSLRND